VPVPPIYLAEEDYGIYSIIDGKQRITAVTDYLNNAFALRGLEEFPELIGARFRDLPRTLQNALRVRPYLRVITLLKQSYPRLKYEVFIRLNRGGIRLNNQEIRNVAFRGPLNDATYVAGENKLLRSALKIEGDKSAAYQQMQDAEFVLRFLTLRDTWSGFSGSLSRSMDDFMLNNRDIHGEQLENLIRPFSEAIERATLLWGDVAFQRWDGQRWDGQRWRQQGLAGMFDAEMIAGSLLSDRQIKLAAAKRDDVVEGTKLLFVDSDFEEAVRLGTNTPSRIKLRIEKVRDMLLSVA
jgi:hypothetical protein